MMIKLLCSKYFRSFSLVMMTLVILLMMIKLIMLKLHYEPSLPNKARTSPISTYLRAKGLSSYLSSLIAMFTCRQLANLRIVKVKVFTSVRPLFRLHSRI